jgi:hypothetical protein
MVAGPRGVRPGQLCTIFKLERVLGIKLTFCETDKVRDKISA